jgi:DNA-binding IclR family transcriptional regulator
VELGLRSLDTRTVTIRDHGHAIWRGLVDSHLTSVALPVRLDSGRAVLECSTDAAPVAEGAAAGGRQLGFAVYDLRLAAAKP